jgi:phage tail sheath protein FI
MPSPKIIIREFDFSHYARVLADLSVGVVGLAQKGETDVVTLLTDPEQLILTFGEPSPDRPAIHAALQYLRAGRILYFVRVAGTSEAKATVTIYGATEPSIKVEALETGSWFNRIDLVIEEETSPEFSLKVTIGDVVFEEFTDLTWTNMEDEINGVSEFITVEQQGTGEVPVDGTYELAGGNDGGDDAEYAQLITNLTGPNNDIQYDAVTIGAGGNDVSIEYVVPWADAFLVANELKDDFNDHFANYDAQETTKILYHDSEDTNLITTANATSEATLLALTNVLRTRYEEHRLMDVHESDDGTNDITSADATDVTTLETLADELKDDYTAHRQSAVFHLNDDDVNLVTAADTTVVTDTVTLAADLDTQYNAHRADIGVHASGDGVNTTATTPSDEATTITFANELRTAYEAHRILTGGVHGIADNVNYVSAPVATDLETAITLLNDIKTQYEAHRQLGAPTHGVGADSSNIVTAADADFTPILTLVNDVKTQYNAHLTAVDVATNRVHESNDTANQESTVDATDQASAITLANALKVVYNAHLTQIVHATDDTTNTVAAAAAVDIPTVYTLLNELKADFNAHRTQTGVHTIDDGQNIPVNPDGVYSPSAVNVVVVGDSITVELETTNDGTDDIQTTSQEVIDAINADASASEYVTADNAPGNVGTGLVTLLAETNLSGGVSAPDYVGEIQLDTKTGLQLLKSEAEVDIWFISVPGITDEGVHAEQIAIAEVRKDCVATIDPPPQLGVQEVIDFHNGEGDYSSRVTLRSSYAVLDWPWVKVRNAYTDADEYTAPSGARLYAAAVTFIDYEPWFPIAGLLRGALPWAIGLGYEPDEGERDVLYSQGTNSVNPITDYPGRGIMIFGQKTLSRIDSALDRLNVRLLLIFIRRQLRQSLVPFIHEPNDEILWRQIRNTITPFLGSLKERRALYDFRVICDETTTKPIDIDNYIVRAKVLLKPVKSAEIIIVDINILATGASFDEYIGTSAENL